MTSRWTTTLVTVLASCCAIGAAALDGGAAPSPARFTIAAAVAVASIAIATPLAFAVARLRFEGRAMVFTMLILASATSPAMLDLGSGTLASFPRALASGVPIATWIVYLLARSLPPEIEDTTALDGAAPLSIWLPLLRPALLGALPLVFLYSAFDLLAR
jgi:ABC-type glycerol-3-phosphate transport system permease component